jgi:hypothetical protein
LTVNTVSSVLACVVLDDAVLKKLLVQMPLPHLPRMEALLCVPKLKAWIANAQPHPYFANRRQVHEHVARTVRDGPIMYFEFGVQQGHTLRYWTTLNAHTASQFVGFDSFQGLPEPWSGGRHTLPAGTYSTGGVVPVIDDPRVSCVAGWFPDTLPVFLQTFHTDLPLVVHCDADLYASTLFVLCTANQIIRPGTILIFDDFSSMLHDFRALEDYTHAFRRRYDVLCAGSAEAYYNNVAVCVTH